MQFNDRMEVCLVLQRQLKTAVELNTDFWEENKYGNTYQY